MKKLAALRHRKQYLVALLLCVIALILYHSRETKFLLYDICPAIATGKYSATLVWDGQASGEIHKVPISDEEFRSQLSTTRVSKHSKSNQMPSPAFDIRVFDGQTTYSVIVGWDNSISIAQLDNLDKTRSFWSDCDESIFERLCSCYVNYCGTRIPKSEQLQA